MVFEERKFKIRAHNKATKEAWMSNIEHQISTCRTRRTSSTISASQASSTRSNIAAAAINNSAKLVETKLEDVNMDKLGPRGTVIVRLITEIAYVSQNLSMLNKHVSTPLHIMSKGATGARDNFYTNAKKKGFLSQGASILNGALEQRKLNAQKVALNTKDMSKFFTTMESLNLAAEALLNALVLAGQEAQWGEDTGKKG